MITINALYIAQRYGEQFIKNDLTEAEIRTLMGVTEAMPPAEIDAKWGFAEQAHNVQDELDEVVYYIGSYLDNTTLFELTEKLLRYELHHCESMDLFLRNTSLAKSMIAYEAKRNGLGGNALFNKFFNAANTEAFLKNLEFPDSLIRHYKQTVIPHFSTEKAAQDSQDLSIKAAEQIVFCVLSKNLTTIFSKYNQKSIQESIQNKLIALNKLDTDLLKGTVLKQIESHQVTDTMVYSYQDKSLLPTALQENVAEQIKGLKKQGTLKLELKRAVVSGNLSRIKRLYALGADINAADESGNCALHIAVIHNFIDFVHYYLTLTECEINKRGAEGLSALGLAVRNNTKTLVRTLLQAPSINVNQTDNAGWSPLHIAASKGYTTLAILLLEAQADTQLALAKTAQVTYKKNLTSSNKKSFMPIKKILSKNKSKNSSAKIEGKEYYPAQIAKQHGHIETYHVIRSAPVRSAYHLEGLYLCQQYGEAIINGSFSNADLQAMQKLLENPENYLFDGDLDDSYAGDSSSEGVQPLQKTDEAIDSLKSLLNKNSLIDSSILRAQQAQIRIDAFVRFIASYLTPQRFHEWAAFVLEKSIQVQTDELAENFQAQYLMPSIIAFEAREYGYGKKDFVRLNELRLQVDKSRPFNADKFLSELSIPDVLLDHMQKICDRMYGMDESSISQTIFHILVREILGRLLAYEIETHVPSKSSLEFIELRNMLQAVRRCSNENIKQTIFNKVLDYYGDVEFTVAENVGNLKEKLAHSVDERLEVYRRKNGLLKRLRHAVKANDLAQVSILCKLGLDINAIYNGRSILIDAVLANQADVVKILCQEYPENATRESIYLNFPMKKGRWQGYSAIHIAAALNYAEVAQILIQAGAKPRAKVLKFAKLSNAIEETELTAIAIAAKNSNHEVLAVLKGDDTHTVSIKGDANNNGIANDELLLKGEYGLFSDRVEAGEIESLSEGELSETEEESSIASLTPSL